MDATNIASVIVAVIALASAVASQRSASKASVLNTNTESRVDMEKDAYMRAREFDMRTIDRLGKENKELRERLDAYEKKREIEEREHEAKNAEQDKRINELQQEVYRLKQALSRNPPAASPPNTGGST